MESAQRAHRLHTGQSGRAWSAGLAIGLLAAAAPLPAASVTLRVEADSSRVIYHISNPLGDVTDLAGSPAGQIDVDRPGGAVQAGRIEVDLRKLATGIGMRDHHVKSAAILDVEKYPLATLVLDVVESGAGSTASAGAPADQKATAHGKLTLHGATHEVAIPMNLRWHGDRLRAIGTFTLALADYGIPRPRRLFIVAGKTVNVHVDLLFVPGGEGAAAGSNP